MCQMRGRQSHFVRMRTEESHFRGNSGTRRDTDVVVVVVVVEVVVVVVAAAAV